MIGYPGPLCKSPTRAYPLPVVNLPAPLLVASLATLALAVSGDAQEITSAEQVEQVAEEMFVSPGAPELREAVPQDLNVVLEERVPQRWLHNQPDDYPLQPARWRRRMPRRCRTQGGYRDHCSGARRVPEPHGEAAALAERLGLGHRYTARYIMHKRPFDEWLAAVAHLDDTRRLEFPVPNGHMGRGFGRTRRGSLRNRRHNGVDIGAPEGNPIVAARDGLVVYSNNEITGYGNVVILLHGEGYSTFYAHCSATHVFAGQFVRRGQQIASIGDTGFAWAPHLHFEWRQRGWVRDPAPHFIRERERERRRARERSRGSSASD